MSLRFLFFAQAADWAKRRTWDINLEKPAKIHDLIVENSELRPITNHLKSLRVAVNREFSTFEHEVKNGDEVAFIPPVSGG